MKNSSLSIASLLMISLLQTPYALGAGAAGSAGTAAGAGSGGSAATGAAPGTGAGGPNTHAPSVPGSSGTSPVDTMKNKQLNQPANPATSDLNQPANTGNPRGNAGTVAPAPPANNCYTVDGQSTTGNCSPGTNPNVR